MANTIKNIGGVTKEYVTQLFNEASLLKGVKRQYSDQFAKDGAKIGNILNVKYMDNIPITRGRQINISPIVERTIPITILDVNQYQAAIDYGSRDYALSIESFNEKTNLKQIARKMANEMEADCARLALGFTNAVGTLGTTPGTAGGVGLLMTAAPQIYSNAGAFLTAAGAPPEDRTMAINPIASGISIGSLSGLQNPVDAISSQYRKGRMGANTLGFDFIENVNLPTFVTGTRLQAAATVAVQSVDGDTSIVMSGLGANATIMQGEHFTVAGVNMVNPMNQLPQGFFQSFVVTANATATAGGIATVPVSPTISLSNPAVMVGTTMVTRYPGLPINVNGTVDALPLVGAAVTFSGAPSATGVFNFGFQRDAIVMTSVDLPVYEGQDKCAQENYEGFNVRVWRNPDIEGDRLICRIDSVVVFTLIRSQLGCVVWG
jgi:hypothetical protein